jgi:F0F1-type ATP synthase delta subunit
MTYKNNSIILNQFWNELKEVLINNENSLNLKKDIIKKIKKTKFNTNELLNFLKINVDNITNDEIDNIKITFSYLDNFR